MIFFWNWVISSIIYYTSTDTHQFLSVTSSKIDAYTTNKLCDCGKLLNLSVLNYLLCKMGIKIVTVSGWL